MKKIILSLTTGCLLSMAGAAFGTVLIDGIAAGGAELAPINTGAELPPINATIVDPNSHINLFASGSTTMTSLTVSPGDAFSLDTYIQFNGYTAVGLSYWLEAENALAPHITLTSESYFQNWVGVQPGTNSTFTGTTGADSGYMREGRDLGSNSSANLDGNGKFVSWKDPRGSGTWQVSTLNFLLDASIAPGTYTLQLTTMSPISSEISEDAGGGAFTDHQVPASTFVLTVVPEPATLSLLALGGLGSLGLTMLRARRKG